MDIACKGSYNVNTIESCIINGTNMKLLLQNKLCLYLRCLNENDLKDWYNIIQASRVRYKDHKLPITGIADNEFITAENKLRTFSSVSNCEVETELYEKITKKCDIILSLEKLVLKYKNNLSKLIDQHMDNQTSVDNDKRFIKDNLNNNDKDLNFYSNSNIYQLNINDSFEKLDCTIQNTFRVFLLKDKFLKEVSELILLVNEYKLFTNKFIKNEKFKNQSLQENIKQIAKQYNALEYCVENYYGNYF